MPICMEVSAIIVVRSFIRFCTECRFERLFDQFTASAICLCDTHISLQNYGINFEGLKLRLS